MIQKQGLQLHAFGCPKSHHPFGCEGLSPRGLADAHFLHRTISTQMTRQIVMRLFQVTFDFIRFTESFNIKIMLIGRSLMILRRLGFVRSFLVSPNVVNIPTLGGSASIIN